jgi:predicted GH43/DUF377 family glycosyl hydrolase
VISLTRLNQHEPLLRPRTGLDWEANGILNPGVTIYNGSILLLYRAVGSDNVSRLGVATTTDGTTFSYPSEKPAFVPDPISKYETQGVEDPRITHIGNRYAVVYVAASINDSPETRLSGQVQWKTRVSLAFTDNFTDFERRGVILHSYNDKNAALFPVKWQEDGGEFYYLYHRRLPSIWLSRSQDLNTWEDVCHETCMIVQPNQSSWDNDRIGIGSQPIYTEYGWLVFYHGRSVEGIYRIGAFLADLQKPEQIFAKLPYPLLEPELEFEKKGLIPNVVFSCGAVEAGENFWVYYGGADFAVGGAYINKKALLDELLNNRLPASSIMNATPQPQTAGAAG